MAADQCDNPSELRKTRRCCPSRGRGHAKDLPTDPAWDPACRGVGWLIAEGGIPRRMKAAYLSDDQVAALAAHAARLRTRAAIAEAMHGDDEEVA